MRRFDLFLNYDQAYFVGSVEIDETLVSEEILSECAIVPKSRVKTETIEHIEVIDFGLIARETVDTRPRDQR